jgi:hypothetical protein
MKRPVSVVNMAIVTEERTTQDQRSVVRFLLWARGLHTKDIHKEIFPVYGGKYLSRKAVHMWVEKRGKRFADGEEVEAEVRKWLRQQSNDFCAAGFDSLIKQWDKCIHVCRGHVKE